MGDCRPQSAATVQQEEEGNPQSAFAHLDEALGQALDEAETGEHLVEAVRNLDAELETTLQVLGCGIPPERVTTNPVPVVKGRYCPYLPRRISKPDDPWRSPNEFHWETPNLNEAWIPRAVSTPEQDRVFDFECMEERYRNYPEERPEEQETILPWSPNAQYTSLEGDPLSPSLLDRSWQVQGMPTHLLNEEEIEERNKRRQRRTTWDSTNSSTASYVEVSFFRPMIIQASFGDKEDGSPRTVKIAVETGRPPQDDQCPARSPSPRRSPPPLTLPDPCPQSRSLSPARSPSPRRSPSPLPTQDPCPQRSLSPARSPSPRRSPSPQPTPAQFTPHQASPCPASHTPTLVGTPTFRAQQSSTPRKGRGRTRTQMSCRNLHRDLTSSDRADDLDVGLEVLSFMEMKDDLHENNLSDEQRTEEFLRVPPKSPPPPRRGRSLSPTLRTPSPVQAQCPPQFDDGPLPKFIRPTRIPTPQLRVFDQEDRLKHAKKLARYFPSGIPSASSNYQSPPGAYFSAKSKMNQTVPSRLDFYTSELPRVNINAASLSPLRMPALQPVESCPEINPCLPTGSRPDYRSQRQGQRQRLTEQQQQQQNDGQYPQWTQPFYRNQQPSTSSTPWAPLPTHCPPQQTQPCQPPQRHPNPPPQRYPSPPPQRHPSPPPQRHPSPPPQRHPSPPPQSFTLRKATLPAPPPPSYTPPVFQQQDRPARPRQRPPPCPCARHQSTSPSLEDPRVLKPNRGPQATSTPHRLRDSSAGTSETSLAYSPVYPAQSTPADTDDEWESLSPSPPKATRSASKKKMRGRRRPGASRSVCSVPPTASSSGEVATATSEPQASRTPPTSTTSFTIIEESPSGTFKKTVRFSEEISHREIPSREELRRQEVSERLSRYGTSLKPPRTASTYRPKPEYEQPLPEKRRPTPPRDPVYGPDLPFEYGSSRPPPRTSAGRLPSSHPSMTPSPSRDRLRPARTSPGPCPRQVFTPPRTPQPVATSTPMEDDARRHARRAASSSGSRPSSRQRSGLPDPTRSDQYTVADQMTELQQKLTETEDRLQRIECDFFQTISSLHDKSEEELEQLMEGFCKMKKGIARLHGTVQNQVSQVPKKGPSKDFGRFTLR